AEQFGTNLRATAAISIPNLVRGCLPLILILFRFLRSDGALGNYITAAWITGIIIMAIGFTAALFIKETFGKELDFVEE
ncbi:MAG TPA: MFS transporter, partial [Chitinophagaceae bacterium]|nr:MFS transporter [Chitinophagaceae bacterium]